jgi:hypothetical protein
MDMRDSRLLIVGDGELAEALRQEMSQGGDRVGRALRSWQVSGGQGRASVASR